MSDRAITYILFVLLGMILGFVLEYFLVPPKVETVKIELPVERRVIDSFYIVKDSIIYRTKTIKEIQHDTIEKIYNLDDTTTINLFYKLVSE